MRGTPYFQAILMVAVFLLTGVPVYRLTRPAAPVAAAAVGTVEDIPTDAAGEKPASLEVEAVFAPVPADFQIKNLGQTILTGRGPQARFTARWTTAVPPEGVDLIVQAHWSAVPTDGASAAAPSAYPAAVRVSVRFPDGRQAEKSFWAGADGALDDVFTVPGEPVAVAP